MPHNYERNCVVYTGTHDNNTICGWYRNLNTKDKEMSINYLNTKDNLEDQINWGFICLAMRSVANICIIPVQDYLGLGDNARINTPSTLGDNWTWRMKPDCFSKELIDKIKILTNIYSRV